MKAHLLILFLILGLFKSNSQNQNFRITNSCEGFSYNFIKPQNWIIDSTNAAYYLAHAALYKSKSDYDNGGLLVQLFAFEKEDENTIEDLKYDVDSYKMRYKNLNEKTFIVNHSEYKTYSTEVFVEDSFYQYIVYLNPGQEYKFGISVALNINNKEVEPKDLELFKDIVRSIKVQ